MDYEKKYKDSLEKARYILHTVETAGCAMHKDLLEEIFPELAESEDERIRREFNDFLCEEIEWRTNDLRDEKDRRTLYLLCEVKDWMDKQKEQKPVEWSEEEKEIERYLRVECSSDDEPSTSEIARHFTQWQKEQMLKDAVEVMVTSNLANNPIIYFDDAKKLGLKYGDKVRIIIMKEDEK